MITLNTLKSYIINFIDSNNSSVIYFGTGSYYQANKINEESNNIIHWKFEENQQFPPFIHDFKFKNLDVPILIVLIDPAFNDNKPYIVSSPNNFLENSWTVSDEFDNLYLSGLGINVIKISDYISWGQNYTNNNTRFNFEEFMVELCCKISNGINNTLLFYHEFVGTNVILLEELVKKKCTFFDSNKICIDITRGTDLSCYFNLSNPEFYPVITQDELNKLKYLNPNLLTNMEKSKIISQYRKFTIGFETNSTNCIFLPNGTNYLFDKPEEMILCFQIIKTDRIILNHIKNGIIPIIRYLYVCTNNRNINLKMWGINYLLSIKSNFQNQQINYQDSKYNLFVLGKIDIILDCISIISNMNDCGENNEHIILIKNNAINYLFEIVKELLLNIFIKYQINPSYIDEFINEIKEIEDKYNILIQYNKFISIMNI